MRVFHSFWDPNGRHYALLPLFLPWLVAVVGALGVLYWFCTLIPSAALSLACFLVGASAVVYLALAEAVRMTAHRMLRDFAPPRRER